MDIIGRRPKNKMLIMRAESCLPLRIRGYPKHATERRRDGLIWSRVSGGLTYDLIALAAWVAKSVKSAIFHLFYGEAELIKPSVCLL